MRHNRRNGAVMECLNTRAKRLGISKGELLRLAREAAEDASLIHTDRLTEAANEHLARDLAIIEIIKGVALAQERCFA